MANTPSQQEAIAALPDWIGRVVDDRYRVDELLGEGGMGAVYVAEHLKLRKRVAFKVIHPEFAGDGEVAARFAREAMASAQLEHQHVASALDYGTLPEGGAYLVMQLVDGPSLQNRIEGDGATEWVEACEIGAQVADALATAHAKGIVHRDLKPDNILMGTQADGATIAKVLDFGIARVAMEERAAPVGAEPGKALTRVGTVMGTPGYMAPEQAMGEAVDASADLYSLGVVLWELVVGKPMFDTRDLTAIVTQQLTQPRPGLREASGDTSIPPRLGELIASMLSTSPSERPESAAFVRDALRQLAYGASLPPGAVGPVSSPGSSTGTARTMLAGSTGEQGIAAPPTGLLPSIGVGPTTLIRSVTDRVPPAYLGIGCATLGVLTLSVLLLASFGGEDGTEKGGDGDEGGLGAAFGFQNLLPEAAQAVEEAIDPVPPEVRERIDTMLESSRRLDRREAANWLLEHEPADDVPDWAEATANLTVGRGCRRKKEALDRIRELGDEEALPAVRRIANSPRRGCGFLNLRDCYSCLRSDLPETIEALGGEDEDEAEEDEPAAKKTKSRRRRRR